jgi:hypothetical protein
MSFDSKQFLSKLHKTHVSHSVKIDPFDTDTKPL